MGWGLFKQQHEGDRHMDTTAKVDLRKLQLLNDRITQVIDALNQVRFSVHGLQHTTGNFIGQVPMTTPYNTQMSSPFGGWNTGGMSPWNQIPFVNPVNGLNHSDVTDPFTAQRISQELASRYGQVVPMPSPFPYHTAAQYAQTFPYAYVPVSPVPVM
jgi:hypothetical protein